VSLLSRDEIRIFIGPHQVDLVRLTGRGKRQVADVRAVAFPASATDKAPWHTALAALEALLAEFRDDKANVMVVLSNHFVRYVLVRHSAEATTTDEEQALTHHYFTNTFGPAADLWEYRLSNSGHNEEFQVAAAVTPELPNALRSLFGETKLILRSIQPHLMAAFNSVRNAIDESAWFALVEPGMLCLVRLDHSQWQFLRMINSRDDWIEELTVNLLRAKVLAKETATEIPVYVFAPGYTEMQWSPLEHQAKDLFGANRMQLLRPQPLSADNLSTVPLFAMALSG